jgi:hypothetical protein
MSTIAKDKLADLVTLPFPVMREISIGLLDAIEEYEDAKLVLEARADLASGEEEALDWEEVKKEMGM